MPTSDGNLPEATPVQLTRMEGTLNLITHQLGEMVRRVDRHEERIGVIELSVQRLGDNAIANEKTVEQTARALKDAKEATEATARAEVAKQDMTWTPMTRLFAIAAAFTSILTAYFAMRP